MSDELIGPNGENESDEIRALSAWKQDDGFVRHGELMDAVNGRAKGVRVIIRAETQDGRQWGELGCELTGDYDKDKLIGKALFSSIHQTITVFNPKETENA